MFGMGFTEILMIAVVAILFLGPDKLPEAMVQVAKFINSFKKTVNEAKSTFEEEVNLKELRQEALSYQHTLKEAGQDIAGFKNAIPNPVDEVREAFDGVKLDEDKKWEGFDDDFEELSEEYEAEVTESEAPQKATGESAGKSPLQKAQESALRARNASQTDKAGEETAEAKKSESAPRPTGFKNLSGSAS